MAVRDQLATLQRTAAEVGFEDGEVLSLLMAQNDTAQIAAMKALATLSEDIAWWDGFEANVGAMFGGGWTKYTLSTDDLTAAALTQSITLYTTGTEEIISGAIIKHSVAFSDGGAPTVSVEVGVSGETDRYSPPYDIAQAVSDTARQATNVLDLEPSPIAIEALFTSSVNVDTLTTGSVDIWVKSGTV